MALADSRKRSRERASEPERSPLSPASTVQWSDFPLLEGLKRADCGGAVGDCLFECISHWLRLRQGPAHRQRSALELRFLAANEFSMDTFAIVDDDIATGEMLAACDSLEDLRWRVVAGSAWGCHSLLLAVLRVVAGILEEPVGVLVAYDAERIPHEFVSHDNCEVRYYIVLYHDVGARHYQLLADVFHSVVYDAQRKCFVGQ